MSRKDGGPVGGGRARPLFPSDVGSASISLPDNGIPSGDHLRRGPEWRLAMHVPSARRGSW